MTDPAIAFALETAGLTLAATIACAVAALVTLIAAGWLIGTPYRPPREGRFTIGALVACGGALTALALQFWSLP